MRNDGPKLYLMNHPKEDQPKPQPQTPDAPLQNPDPSMPVAPVEEPGRDAPVEEEEPAGETNHRP